MLCFFKHDNVLSALDILQPPHIDFFHEMWASIIILCHYWKHEPVKTETNNDVVFVFLQLCDNRADAERFA